MIEIDFENTYDEKYSSYEEYFNLIAEKAYKLLKLKGEYYLEVNFINDEEIHSINRQYRNVDRPTDVISFAFLDAKDELSNIKNPVFVDLGEIFISIDTALRQAKEYAHSEEREICFLFTHGILHLLGYDHMKEEDEKIMFKLQDDILEETPWKKSN